jgi:hypothetical protein
VGGRGGGVKVALIIIEGSSLRYSEVAEARTTHCISKGKPQ